MQVNHSGLNIQTRIPRLLLLVDELNTQNMKRAVRQAELSSLGFLTNTAVQDAAVY